MGGIAREIKRLVSERSAVFDKQTGQPRAATYGDGVDGLLGLSFLSRFNVTIDGHTVRIAPNKPR